MKSKMSMNDLPPARGPAVAPFYAGEIGLHAAALRRAGRQVIPMHFGAPSAGPPPVALEAARRSLTEPDLGYWESAVLKERLAHHYADTYGVNVSVDRILLTNGASAALVAIFTALFAAGDRVAIARPGYPAYRHALRALGRIAVEVECGIDANFELTPDLLESQTEALNGVLVASPANPTGATLSKPQMAALAAYCRGHGVWFISDEIYHGITYEAPATSALEVDPDAVVIGSFSKLYRLPSWRLGWVIAPESAIAQLRAHLINFFLTPPAISQHAALAALGAMPELLGAVEVYRSNRDFLAAELPGCGFGSVARPAGAFYIYADASRFTTDSLQFCHDLLDQTGIALAPGIDFDAVNGNSAVRFSFVTSIEQTRQAVELLRKRLR